MERKTKIGWIIVITSITILFAFQLIILNEAYQHEKYILQDRIENTLLESIIQQNFQSIAPNGHASYNPKQNCIIITKEKLDTVINVHPNLNSDSLIRMVMYDIRDAKKWNLTALSQKFDTLLSIKNITYQFTLTDSLSKIQDEFRNSLDSLKSPDISLMLPLGYSEKHLLQGDFIFPVHFFINQAWDRLLITLTLFLLLICLISSLYFQLKLEKKARENQDLFTHTLVHNLRSPVLNIKRQLEIIMNDPNCSEDKEQLNNCRQWVDKTLEDIENLLTLSVNAYGIKAYDQPTDMDDLLNQIAEEYRQMDSIEKRVSILIDNQISSSKVQIDPLLLYGALGNLLGNAIKYSGPEVGIRINCCREARKIILTVEDNGFGIPVEEQKYIFEAYSRGQRYQYDKQRKGFGLGLSYVAAVVKAHHGRIKVESDGQQGTRFTIEIPQKRKG